MSGTLRPSALSFRVQGLSCAEEVAILRRQLGPLVGEGRLSFDVLNGKMTVSPDGPPLAAEVIVEAVARTGMRASIWREGNGSFSEETPRRGLDPAVLTSASGVLVAAGFLYHAWSAGGFAAAIGSEGLGQSHDVPAAARALYALGIAAGAWGIVPKAWFALKRLRPDMNLLMTIAVVGAIAIGEWFEAATVSFLFALSHALESWSVGRARRAVAALMDLSPPTARLLKEDGSTEDVPLAEVLVGATVLVPAGQRIPLDGRVLRGSSLVNQAPITGESLPVEKNPGDTVYAGTINGDGALEVECTKAASDTTLAHIIKMVSEAQSRRGPSEQWVERFARIYTPAVFALAILVLLAPPLLLGGAWSDWLYRALVLLVIGCPCALVISTPVSIVAALAAAARNGVLIKGGLYVELPSRLKALAMDKTGTLTEGRPRVAELVPMGGHSEREVLEVAAALESRTEHPLAIAIREHAAATGVVARAPEDFQILQGKGARGRVLGREYWLGSHRFLEERGQETTEVHQRLQELSASGHSVVVLGDGTHVCGFIGLADAVRPNAAKAVEAIRRAGVEHVVMLTGDNRGTAERIARETGVDILRAELLPADKVAAVEELVTRYEHVAMVGDGVNDAPALARASLGIAMGAAGSDAAIETADVALMSDDLSKIAWLIAHSRATLVVIRQNIVASLSVKAIFVALTFAGHASLWAAIAADMGASLLVIGNGLRLLRRLPPSMDQASGHPPPPRY
jgi:Cd2+/Zn2+-exporting ATPase